MKYLKAFFYVFFKSSTSLDYYKDLPKTDLKFSLKYFFTLGLLAAFVASVGFSIKIIPDVKKITDDFGQQLLNLYPNDFELKIENNEWSINQDEPYAIPFPDIGDAQDAWENSVEQNSVDENGKIPANLIVFYHEGTIEDIETFDSLAILNSKNLVVKDANKIQAYPLKEMPNGTLNKSEFGKFVVQLDKIASFAPIIVGIFFAVGFMFYYLILRSFYLLFVGLVLFTLSFFTPRRLDYLMALKIATHTMTLPVVIELVLMFVAINLPIPLWFMFSNIILGAVVVMYLGKLQPEEVAPVDSVDDGLK